MRQLGRPRLVRLKDQNVTFARIDLGELFFATTNQPDKACGIRLVYIIPKMCVWGFSRAWTVSFITIEDDSRSVM